MLVPRPVSGHTGGSAQPVPAPGGPPLSPRPVGPAGSWHLIPACSSLGTHPALTVSLCSPRVLGGIPDPANTDLVFPKLDLFIYSSPRPPFPQSLMLGASWGHSRGGGRGSVFASPFMLWLGGRFESHPGGLRDHLSPLWPLCLRTA